MSITQFEACDVFILCLIIPHDKQGQERFLLWYPGEWSVTC